MYRSKEWSLVLVFYCIKQLFALIAVVYLLYKCYKAGGDAELLGVPRVVVVGRDAAEGFAEVWNRETGARDRVAIAEVPSLV